MFPTCGKSGISNLNPVNATKQAKKFRVAIRLLRRFNTLTLFALLLPLAAMDQGAFIPARSVQGVVNSKLRSIGHATITLCAANTPGIPCSPGLSNALFKDAALTVPMANPQLTDANGNYPQMAIAAGNYTFTESAPGFAGFSYHLSVSCTTGTCTANSVTLTGPTTITGSLTARAGQNQINNAVYAGTMKCDGSTD